MAAMANYICSARSNYFRVKDRAAFEKEMADFEVQVVEDREGRLALLNVHPDGGGWPMFRFNEKSGVDEEIDFFELVASYLAGDEVAVFVEAGAEKLRYIVGYAVAINAAGQREELSLNEIYGRARKLGSNVTVCDY